MNLPCLNKVTTATTTTTTTSTKARKRKQTTKNESEQASKQASKQAKKIVTFSQHKPFYELQRAQNGHLVDGISTADRKYDFQSRDLQPRWFGRTKGNFSWNKDWNSLRNNPSFNMVARAPRKSPTNPRVERENRRNEVPMLRCIFQADERSPLLKVSLRWTKQFFFTIVLRKCFPDKFYVLLSLKQRFL